MTKYFISFESENSKRQYPVGGKTLQGAKYSASCEWDLNNSSKSVFLSIKDKCGNFCIVSFRRNKRWYDYNIQGD